MHKQTGEELMKKPVLTFAFLTALLIVSVAPVHASVSVKSTIGDVIYVTYDFENLDPSVYSEAMANDQFNSTTIPQIIKKNLEKQNLTRVNYGFQPNTNDDATNTIRVSFYLGGSDIISFTLNRTIMRRTYQVKTEWRKFQFNLTSSFSIDFAQVLAEPVEQWQKINQTAYIYPSEENDILEISFQFALPEEATQVQVEGDTITYEVPPYFEDVFLNSPFLILTVLLIIVVIVLIYRKLK